MKNSRLWAFFLMTCLHSISCGRTRPQLQAPANPTATTLPNNTGGKIIPPVSVIGSFLVAELINDDGSPMVNAKVELKSEDRAFSLWPLQFHLSLTEDSTVFETDEKAQFKIPVKLINSATLRLKIYFDGRIISSQLIIPPDLAKDLSQARFNEGLEPLQNFPITEKTKPQSHFEEVFLASKLAMQFPANRVLETNSSDPEANAEEWVILNVTSLPLATRAGSIEYDIFSGLVNLSNTESIRFLWNESFEETPFIHIAYAVDDASLLAWDGNGDSAISRGISVISDYSSCTDPQFRNSSAGLISTITMGKCGILRDKSPFNEGGDLYFRVAALSESTAKLSPVIRIALNNEPPTLEAISDKIVSAGTQMVNIDLGLDDKDSKLTCGSSLSVNSENSELLPNKNVYISGSFPACRLTFYPISGAVGDAVVNVRASDGSLSSSRSFVFAVNAAPTLSSLTNQIINEDSSTGAISFTIEDANDSAQCAQVIATSDNPTLVPNSNTNLSVSGNTEKNCTITVTPAADQSGSATIALLVNDGSGAENAMTTVSFVITVLDVNEAPTITAISNQFINEDNNTGAISFTIEDADDTVQCAQVVAASNNTTLVPNSTINLSVGGDTGKNCTITVTPAADKSGSTTIILSLNDGSGAINAIAETSYNLSVNPIDDSTAILTTISNQTIPENSSTDSLSFTLSDPDNPVQCSQVNALSDNTVLVPNSSANLTLSGDSGTLCSLKVTPSLNQRGSAAITLNYDNNGNNEVLQTFTVTVTKVSLWVSRLTSPVMTGSAGYDNIGKITFGAGGTSFQAFHHYPASESGKAYLVLVRRNAAGQVLWSRKLTPHIGNSIGLSSVDPHIIAKPDDSVFVGWGPWSGSTYHGVYFSSSGDLLWRKTYTIQDSFLLLGVRYLPFNDRILLLGRAGSIGNVRWIGISAGDGSVSFAREMSVSGATGNGVYTREAIQLDNGRIVTVGNLSWTVGMYIAEFDPSFSSYSSLYSYNSNSGGFGARLPDNGFVFADSYNTLLRVDSGYNAISHKSSGRNVSGSGLIGLVADAASNIFLSGRNAYAFDLGAQTWDGTWNDGAINKYNSDLSAVSFTTKSRAKLGSSSGYAYNTGNANIDLQSGRALYHWSSQNMTQGYSVMAVCHSIETTTSESHYANSNGNSARVQTTTLAQSTGDAPAIARTEQTWNLSDFSVSAQEASFVSNDASGELTWSFDSAQ
jgi:hypothetical protein